MLVTDPAAMAALFRRVLAGEVRLYAWGAVAHFACYHWRLPWPFAGVIDSAPAKAGRSLMGMPILPPDHLATLDPERTLIMILPLVWPFFGQICDQIAGYGPFPAVPFQSADAIGRLLGVSQPPADLAALLADRRRFAEDRDGLVRDLIATGTADPVEALAATIARHRPPPRPITNRRRACLAIGRLALGGAERQITVLAGGLAEAGWEVSVIADGPAPPEAAEYLADLDRHGVQHRVHGAPNLDPAETLDAALAGLPACAPLLLWHLPAHLVWPTAQFWHAFQELEPDLVVAYLDRPASAAAVAGLLTGVPRIQLSGQGYSPSAMPINYGQVQAGFRQVHQAVLQFPGVRMVADAVGSARSYADWLGLDPAAVGVVPNCVPPGVIRPPDPDEANRLRAQYRLDPDAPLILGVFRLSLEKAPLLFIEVVARLARTNPALRAIICGVGPMHEEVAVAIRRLELDGVVTLAGAVGRPGGLYRLATLLLHTAEIEGTPNVVLEAQALGVPVVATNAGGTAEGLSPRLLPYLAAVGDADALERNCRALLADRAAARALGATIAAEIGPERSLARLVQRTLTAAGLA